MIRSVLVFQRHDVRQMDSCVGGNDQRASGNDKRAMSNNARWDAIVIGAGIVGAACARNLARDGMRVLVLDAGRAGEGTTSKGMGHVVTLDGSEPQLALTSYSVALWRELAPALATSVEYDPCGTIWVAEDADQMDALVEKQRAYDAHDIRNALLSPSQLRDAEPNLRHDLAGGLLVAGDAVLLPPFATQWLVAQAAIAGAELREGWRVDAIEGNTVRCGDAVIEADVIVNAAGVHSPVLTPGLRVVPRKGQLAITERYPGTVRHQLVELGYVNSAHEMDAESVAFNVQPRVNGQVIIGASRELVGFDEEINTLLLDAMLDRAAHFLPVMARLSIERAWTGFRPAAEDGLPLIGRWDPAGPLWIATGHEGLGITSALGTAVMLADLVAGRTPSIDPTPFAPSRMRATQTTSRTTGARHAEG
jgi:glycine/D-amino acid oxidase-like deaminating enzyme